MADPLRVLYVDDEPGLLEIGKYFLEANGEFVVDTLSSAKEALEHLQKVQYEAIISDYKMPDMDGIQFLVEVRTKFGSIPYILFTGRGREEIVIQAINSGADFYVQKGGQPEAQFTELAHKVRSAVIRHRTEKLARDTERRLSDIINFLPDATFAIDMAGKVIAWNRAVEELTGVPASDMLGKGNYEYSIPFYRERRPILIDFVLSSDATMIEKYPDIKKDGDKLVAEIFIPHFHNGSGTYLWFTASPLFDSAGKITGAIESIREITARKRAEEELVMKNEELNASYEQLSASEEELRQNYEELAVQEQELRESEERFRTLIQNSTDIIRIINAEGLIVYESPSATRILGYSPGFTTGKSPLEFIHADDREFVRKAILEVYSRANPGTPTEFRIRKADGSYLYVEAIASNLIGVPGIDGIVTTTRPIEERKKFADALKKSEERFRGITERISDLIIITDPEGIPTYISPSIQKILGYFPEYFTGVQEHPEIFPEEDIMKIGLAIKRLNEGSPEEQIEFRMKRQDGSYSIFDGVGRPVLEGDTYAGVQIIARDITRRKNAENSLRIQHDLILELNHCTSLDDACNRILSATLQIEGLDSGGIYIADPTTGALDLLVSRGLSPGFVRHVSHYDPDSPYVTWAKAGTPFYGKFADIRKPIGDEIQDGEGINTVASIPVMHEGSLVALLNVASHTMDDIPKTARQTLEMLASEVGSTVNRIRSRMMLLESEKRYRSLVENLNDVVFTVDRDGFITYISPVGERQYGYPASDLIGKPFTEVVFEEDIPALLDRFRDIGRGLIRPFEWRLRHRDGTLSWVRTSTRPVDDGTGSSSFLGVISNISQQKKDEEAICQANRQLSLLTEITRHDINNQLMVLNGFLKLLQKKVPDPGLEDYFKRINGVTSRISSMIEFTREYGDIGVSAPAWQNCHILIDTLTRDTHPGMVQVKNDLPSDAEIFADPLISKVFSNLIDNAVRYGGKITRIRFFTEQRGSDHVLFCEDDGAGIPVDEKEKIFERGYGKNTGLGLALSREILSITGITIAETGESGKGSRFEIVIPADMWRSGHVNKTGA